MDSENQILQETSLLESQNGVSLDWCGKTCKSIITNRIFLFTCTLVFTIVIYCMGYVLRNQNCQFISWFQYMFIPEPFAWKGLIDCTRVELNHFVFHAVILAVFYINVLLSLVLYFLAVTLVLAVTSIAFLICTSPIILYCGYFIVMTGQQ
jgi:hypothetical protein